MVGADILTEQVLAYANRHSIGVEPYYLEIPRISITLHLQSTELSPVLYRPIFCLVLQGAKQIGLGNETIRSAEGHALIVGLDVPTFSRVTDASRDRPYLALAIDIDMMTIREIAAELNGLRVEHGPVNAIAAGDADDAILNAMQRLFCLIEKPAAASILQPLIMREIHFWLLSAQHGKLLRQLVQPDSHAAHISEAIVRIRRHYNEPLSIPDLARVVGMSGSGFHEHFKAMCGTTPLQFQKRLRLMEARRLIICENVSVASAAAAVGYESPTQFSREFARMFGASPREHRQTAFHRKVA